MTLIKRSAPAGALLFFFALAFDARAASTRVYLASNGADSGACTRTAPCKTFPYAFTQVLAKGEVVVLDTSSHPAVTVNKSVTIVAAPGAYVVVSSTAAGSTAITVTIAAADAVVLRGLTVTGHGTAAHGIRFTGAGTLMVEGCAVSGFNTHGIWQSGSGKMHVKDTEVRNGQQYGIRMYVNSGRITGSIDHCRVGNIVGISEAVPGTGILVGNNARVSVSNTVSSGSGGYEGNGGLGYGGCGFWVGGSGRMLISDSTAEGSSGAGFCATEGGRMDATHCRAIWDENGFMAYAAGVMTIDGSVAASNMIGIVSSDSGSSVRVANTTVADNYNYGLVQVAGGIFISRGNNNLYGNGLGQTSGTITLDTTAQ